MNELQREAFERAGYAPRRPLHAGRDGVELWLLSEVATGRPVVAKMPSEPASTELLAHEAEMLEAVTAAAAGVPGFPQLVGLVQTGNALCPVLAFVDGIALDRIVARARGPVPAAAAIGWAVDLCHVLERLHAVAVVHRDVQPRHVLVRTDPADGQPSIVLLDFTAACRMTVPTDLDRARAGELPFAAPEQFEPEPVSEAGAGAPGSEATAPAADPRSDIYSVAATIFRLLTGRGPVRPFRYPALASLRPDLPWQLHAAIDRALSRDPAKRPQRAAEMAVELEAAWNSLCASSRAKGAAPPAPVATSNRGAGARPSGDVVAASPFTTHPGEPGVRARVPTMRPSLVERIEITAEERAALTGQVPRPAPRDPEAARVERDALKRVLQRAHERALAAGLDSQALLEMIEAGQVFVRPRPIDGPEATRTVDEAAATAATGKTTGGRPSAVADGAPARGPRRVRRAMAESTRQGVPARPDEGSPQVQPPSRQPGARAGRPFQTRRQRRRWQAVRFGMAVLLALALAAIAYRAWRGESPPPARAAAHAGGARRRGR